MNIFTEAALQNPLGFNNIAEFVKGILGIVMYIGIPMIGLVLVYAGFKFLFARGKSDQISKAVFNIKWALLGVAIFLGAWALASLVDSTIKSIMNG